MTRADKETGEQKQFNTPSGKAWTGTVSEERWIELLNAAATFEPAPSKKDSSSGSSEE
jgi:hypothetical protein